MTDKPVFIRWFKDIGLGDVTAVGGKNASLGELYRELAAAGVRVPNGFAITSDAFRYFVREAGLTEAIEGLTAGLSTTDLPELARRGRTLREAIVNASLPTDLQQAIVSAYEQLGDGSHADVAVRSSATAERSVTSAICMPAASTASGDSSTVLPSSCSSPSPCSPFSSVLTSAVIFLLLSAPPRDHKMKAVTATIASAITTISKLRL